MTKDTTPPFSQTVRIMYTNWRGETANRLIHPIKIWYGSTEWHPAKQWFLQALDIEKQAERDFALQDIQRWEEV